jgi:hypothetical protein
MALIQVLQACNVERDAIYMKNPSPSSDDIHQTHASHDGSYQDDCAEFAGLAMNESSPANDTPKRGHIGTVGDAREPCEEKDDAQELAPVAVVGNGIAFPGHRVLVEGGHVEPAPEAQECGHCRQMPSVDVHPGLVIPE